MPTPIGTCSQYRLAPSGKLSQALIFSYADARLTRIEATADPARLRELDLAVL